MPKLREIIQIINTALQAGPFDTRKFQKGQWYGLAYQVTREEARDNSELVKVTRPAVVTNDGEGTAVDYNDKYPLQFYHRLTGPLQYPDLSKNDNEGFGQPAKDNKEIAELVMICIGDRSKLGVYQEDVCAGIVVGMPREFTSAQLTTLSLEDANIEIIDTNTNPVEVFEQEYKGVDFNLPPQFFMISVKYKITTLYNAACFQLCS